MQDRATRLLGPGSRLPLSVKNLLKGLAFPILILAAVAGSLFLIFLLLSSAVVSEAVGIGLFLIVAGLLVVGYMVGLMFVGLVGITVVADRLGRPHGQHSKEHPA